VTEYTFDGGYTATRLLFSLEKPPSAIYAANDEAALGAVFGAQEMGLTLPGQLSICGHDDLAISAHVWPGLTTIHQPVEDMLEQAVRLLIDLLKGGPIPGRQVILPPRLMIRGSTSNAPGG
jgi:DNA-binding LacI/PurR family transcriptional regulator